MGIKSPWGFFRVRPQSTLKLSAEQPTTVPKVNSQVSNYTHLSIVSLIQNQATFQGGRLSQFQGVWKRLTSDPFILDAISHCHIDFDTEPIQDHNNVNPQCKFTDAQQTIIDPEIAKLNKRIIKPSEHESGGFISPIFTMPKKDGSHRVIFNLKALNASVITIISKWIP